MGRSISLCTMAVRDGPGIRASWSSSRASWHDFPTFDYGEHDDDDDDGKDDVEIRKDGDEEGAIMRIRRSQDAAATEKLKPLSAARFFYFFLFK